MNLSIFTNLTTKECVSLCTLSLLKFVRELKEKCAAATSWPNSQQITGQETVYLKKKRTHILHAGS